MFSLSRYLEIQRRQIRVELHIAGVRPGWRNLTGGRNGRGILPNRLTKLQLAFVFRRPMIGRQSIVHCKIAPVFAHKARAERDTRG